MPDRAYVTIGEFERMKAERDASLAQVIELEAERDTWKARYENAEDRAGTERLAADSARADSAEADEENSRLRADLDAAIARAEKARAEGVEATFRRIRNSLGPAYEKMVRAVIDPGIEEEDEKLAR